jgi:hypothetical protein
MTDFIKKEGQSLDERLGRCYELAGKFCIENGWDLVHGFITDKRFGSGHTIDHAWCEENEMCYDPVLDLELPKDAFMRLLGCEITKKYHSSEYSELMITTGHFGPWHEIDNSKIVFNQKKS